MPETIGMKTAQADGYLCQRMKTLVFTLTIKLSYSRLNFHLLAFSIIHSPKAVMVNS